MRYWTGFWEMRSLESPVFPNRLIQSSPVTILGFTFEEHEKNSTGTAKAIIK